MFCFNKLTCFADKYTSALAVLRHKITKNPKIFMMNRQLLKSRDFYALLYFLTSV